MLGLKGIKEGEWWGRAVKARGHPRRGAAARGKFWPGSAGAGEMTKLTGGARVAVTNGESGRLGKAWSEKENVFLAKTRPTRGLDGPVERFWPAGDGAANGLAGLRGCVGRKVGRAEIRKKNFWIKNWIFLYLPRLWEFVEGDLGGILTWGFFPKFFWAPQGFYKNIICHAMQCNASYTRFIFGSFSYVL
jgi:hypothetical protein